MSRTLIGSPNPAGPSFTYTKSILFTAANEERLNMGNVAALDFDGSTAFSIVLWHKLTSIAFQGMVTKTGGAAATFAGWGLYMDGAGRLRFILTDGSGGILNVFHSTAYSTGAWAMSAVTYSGSGTAAGVALYKNGSALAKSTALDTFAGSASNSAEARIAARGDGIYYDGNIFTVGIYSGVLSAANIAAINALSPKDLTTGPGTLIGNWRMGNDSDDDATSGTGTIYDRVGGLNATPVNTSNADIVTDAP